MSDLGQILISISDKLSKLISRVNKLERNVYKIAKSFEPGPIAAGDLPVKQLSTTSTTTEQCPNLRSKDEFNITTSNQFIHAIRNADELVEITQTFSDSACDVLGKKHSFNSGDTALLSQSVTHEDLTPRAARTTRAPCIQSGR